MSRVRERLTMSDVEQLHRARSDFGPGGARRARETIARCATRSISSARTLRAYHDTLLFHAAYPHDAHVLTLVTDELERIATIARGFDAATLDRLADTGIAGTDVTAPFTLALTRWICRHYPGALTIAWEDGSAGAVLDDRLPLLVSSVEADGLQSSEPSTEEWVRAAAGATDPLEFLLAHVDRLGGTPETIDVLFESLELPLRWRLDATSLGSLRVPVSAVHLQRTPPDRRGSARRRVRSAVAPFVRVRGARAHDLLTRARLALALRGRETDPTTYGTPDEIYRVRLTRGVELIVLGIAPERRLPIESFFGYVAAKNGVPVAYGGAWIFFDRGEIGINVFEPFRHGESARLFSEIIAVYHHHFGARYFEVDPFQFGAGNREAIHSGAFWFYAKLGFRPVDEAVRRLAAEESERMRRDRRHRTPPDRLRRLASARLRLDLTRGAARNEPPSLATLAQRVSTEIGTRFAGDRSRAERWAWREVLALDPDARPASWPEAERRAASQLAMLVALLPDLGTWSRRDRRALHDVLRAKGGAQERTFVRRTRAHRRLLEALLAFAGGTSGASRT